MSPSVKVFGCRPLDGRCRAHRRPASENLQGRKPREGIRGWRGVGYGDLSAADEVCDCGRGARSELADGEAALNERRVRVERGEVVGRFETTAGYLSALCRGRSRTSDATSDLRDCDGGHEVSILMTIVGPVGRCRGVAPRSKTSMMIMRPPQHGQAGLLGSAAASAGSALRLWSGEQFSRACDVVGAGAAWRTGRSGGCGGSRWAARG